MLYGDSSGGGLALALLILLRDSNLPLPAGTVLLSPWVDLTHSFPSVMGDPSGDYIPAEGFHFKPSLAWPPIREAPLVFKKGKQQLVIREQIQLYCSNQVIGHPLVSLINQGSLGGLPPMLIVSGSCLTVLEGSNQTDLAFRSAVLLNFWRMRSCTSPTRLRIRKSTVQQKPLSSDTVSN